MLMRWETTDLWQWNLDDPGWDRYTSVLNAWEQEYAARFHGEVLLNRSGRSRCVIRLVLSSYLKQPAASHSFFRNAYGKPGLVGASLHFNLSHSRNQALMAVSGSPVGVDIEACAVSEVDIDELLDWICYPEERRSLLLLDKKDRETALYQLWTQKEAYCKAAGDGLQRDFSTINLARLTSSCARVLDAEHPFSEGCFVHSVSTVPGFLASLCTSQVLPRLSPVWITPDEVAVNESGWSLRHPYRNPDCIV